MQDRILFRLLIAAQFLVFAMFFAVGLYLIAVAHSPKTDPAAVGQMQFSAAVCLLICPLWLIPVAGVRKKAAWGWWFGLSVNLLVSVLLAWVFVFSQSNSSSESLAYPAIFLVLVFLHLLSRPGTWNFKESPKIPGYVKRK